LERPKFRILDVATGAEHLVRSRPGSGVGFSDFDLGPTKRVVLPFGWRALFPDLPPGEYEVSARVPWQQDSRWAESSPVRIRIRPAAPRNLTIAKGRGPVLHAAWINAASDPPEVVWSRFGAIAGGGIVQHRRLGAAGHRTAPVPSLTADLRSTRVEWVAWIDGPSLRCEPILPKRTPTSVPRFALGRADSRILAPVHSAPMDGPDAYPRAVVSILAGTESQEGWHVDSIEFALEETRLQSRIEGEGPTPVWAHPFVATDGAQTLALLQQKEAGADLTLWRGLHGPPREAPPSARWMGRLLAATATQVERDAISGSMLLWESRARLVVGRWSVDPKKGLSVLDPVELEWPFGEPALTRIQAGPNGGFAALLLSDEGNATLFRGTHGRPVDANAILRGFPFELVFLAGEEPALLLAEEGLGFRLALPSGFVLV